MGILARRLLVIALSGLAGSVAVGLLATNVATLILGILALGMGLIVAILFYLLRPVPSMPMSNLADLLAPAITPEQPAVEHPHRERPSAEIIVFPRAPD